MISISHPISMSRSLNNYYKALVVYHHPVTKSISGKIVGSSRLKESHWILFAVRWFTQSSRNIQSMQLISDTNSLDDNYYQNLSQESQLYMAKMRWVLYETQYTCVISNASNQIDVLNGIFHGFPSWFMAQTASSVTHFTKIKTRIFAEIERSKVRQSVYTYYTMSSNQIMLERQLKSEIGNGYTCISRARWISGYQVD